MLMTVLSKLSSSISTSFVLSLLFGKAVLLGPSTISGTIWLPYPHLYAHTCGVVFGRESAVTDTTPDKELEDQSHGLGSALIQLSCPNQMHWLTEREYTLDYFTKLLFPESLGKLEASLMLGNY